jgi:tetratricopeptide (TPR) repeat protein
MSPKAKVYTITGLLALGVITLLWLMPRQPASSRERSVEEHQHQSDTLALALEMINGDNPMEGILMLRQLVEKDSTNIEAQMYLGLFSIQSSQFDKARERFETVLRLDPGNPEALWQLGQLNFGEQKFEEAAINFRALTQANAGEEYVNAWFFLGRSLEFTGDTKGALECYETFQPLNTDTAVANKLDGFIEELRKKLNE